MRKVTYLFEFEGDKSWNYELNFDDRHNFLPRDSDEIKHWTRLETDQCPHCPLAAGTCAQCPVARNLDQIVDDSRATASYAKARVTVVTENRIYSKSCDMQEALCSLFGLIMASSGCPHLEWLRPLARFHLPFADVDETFFRVLSLQLMEQFFAGSSGSFADAAKVLEQRYQAVEKVNHAFANRIRQHCKADADTNAIVALDIFVQLFPFELQSNFESLRKYFQG